ncbi:MAG: hypothetical protein PWQ93_398 [Clostridiales bacterium]|nr:hypothetical protein [Clostridiales bacterium]
MTFGLVALIAIAILIVFGVAQRVLDKLRLSDTAALLFVGAMIVGTFLPDIPLGFGMSINIGGGIVPIILAVYLLVKAETSTERNRAIIASFIAGAAVFLVGRLFPSEPETMPIDPMYIYGIMAGLIAYLFGRSRRSAFIAGIMGMIIADVAQALTNLASGITAPVSIGGAGMFDATVISGLLAVLLAELVGESREKLQGGTAKKDMGYDKGHFTSMLGQDRENSDELSAPDIGPDSSCSVVEVCSDDDNVIITPVQEENEDENK